MNTVCKPGVAAQAATVPTAQGETLIQAVLGCDAVAADRVRRMLETDPSTMVEWRQTRCESHRRTLIREASRQMTASPALFVAVLRDPPAPGAAGLVVHLHSRGDVGPRLETGQPVSPTQLAYVHTLGEAVAVCREYIELHGLGGDHWSGGQVAFAGEGANGNCALVSYNGRTKTAAGDAPIPAGELALSAAALQERRRRAAGSQV